MAINNAAGRGIVLSRLSKSYGAVRAVRSIDLAIAPGETVALLGPKRGPGSPSARTSDPRRSRSRSTSRWRAPTSSVPFNGIAFARSNFRAARATLGTMAAGISTAAGHRRRARRPAAIGSTRGSRRAACRRREGHNRSPEGVRSPSSWLSRWTATALGVRLSGRQWVTVARPAARRPVAAAHSPGRHPGLPARRDRRDDEQDSPGASARLGVRHPRRGRRLPARSSPCPLPGRTCSPRLNALAVLDPRRHPASPCSWPRCRSPAAGGSSWASASRSPRWAISAPGPRRIVLGAGPGRRTWFRSTHSPVASDHRRIPG